VLVCGVFAVLLFPALVPIRLGPSQLRPIETPWLPALVRRHRRAILVVAALLTIGLGAASFNLRVNPAVQQLQPTTPEGDVEGRIARRFGLPDDAVFAVAEGPDLDPLLEKHARLASAIAAAGADVTTNSPVALLPSMADQQTTAARMVRAGIDPATFAHRLEVAAAAAGFRPGSFEPFVKRLPRVLDSSQRLTLDGFREHGLAPAVSHFVAQHGGRYVTVTYIYPRSPAGMVEVERAIEQVGGGLRLTGLSVVNRELESRFVPEFVKGSLIGIAGVIVLIIAGFRSVRLALWSIVPVGLGVWWSAGILALAGFDLDLFSVFGVLMCIGIGVDYGVHLLHRRSEEREDGTRIALTRTAPAILLSGLTAIIGFGSFISSSYGPLHALGVITAVTIATCLVTSLLVLPALLGDA